MATRKNFPSSKAARMKVAITNMQSALDKLPAGSSDPEIQAKRAHHIAAIANTEKHLEALPVRH